jgi:hypothetical protein
VHQGFANVASSLWPGITAALQDVIKSNGKIDNVYVAGHSLGAGVATLISYATQVGDLSVCCPSVPLAIVALVDATEVHALNLAGNLYAGNWKQVGTSAQRYTLECHQVCGVDLRLLPNTQIVSALLLRSLTAGVPEQARAEGKGRCHALCASQRWRRHLRRQVWLNSQRPPHALPV